MRIEQLPVDYVLKRADIIAAARDWVGAPYKHQGRGRKGIDCVGLLIEVAKALGHPVTAPTAYSNMPKGYQLLDPCNEQLWKPARQNILPGDLAVFWGWNQAEPQHFAFIGANPRLTVIHSFSKHESVVEQPYNRFWTHKFHCLFTLPGTEENGIWPR